MTASNLSKIRPKLRTQGRVSGNFGKNKVRAGSSLREIGETKAETVRITPQDKYIQRMISIYMDPPDDKMWAFARLELHRLGCFEEKRLDENDCI